MRNRTPPALRGHPFIGHILEYRRDHLGVFWNSYRALGPVFSLRLGPQRMAVMVGPDANRFFFSQVDKILSLPEVNRFVIPMFGKVLNAADDYHVRRGHLALLHSAFHPRRMAKHISIMACETSRWFDQLGDHGEFELSDALSTLAMRIAASALMGPEVREKLDEFIPLLHDLARGMDFVLPPGLPLPRFRRRDRAREKLHTLIKPIIAQRLKERDRHDDFFQTIVTSGRSDNAVVPDDAMDETVVGLSLLTVFTAYIATAAQASWSIVQLLQAPDYLSSLISEQRSILGQCPEESLCTETLDDLKLLDWTLRESQRMHPVMSHYARYNAQGYAFRGYDIPKGWLSVICPAIAHRDPDIFSNPDEYDPLRFAPGREEDKKDRYSLIGFGAGLYRCPGAAFGVNEMKTIISLLFHRYDLKLAESNVRPDCEMGVVRPRPCRLLYRRRSEPTVHGSMQASVDRTAALSA
jgi:sterol 14-demethylase